MYDRQHILNRPDYSEAASAQAFFANMAALRCDDKAAKAHWDLALNYQRDHMASAHAKNSGE
ncbi:MAG: hypothetical protein AB3N15_10470 [Paracoccaceae bacterium]